MDPLRASNKLRRLIRAYHGSPHSFSRFDASKIGTGEGAQAYGHGLYFAGDENVARQYRNKLGGRRDVFIGDDSATGMNETLRGGPAFDTPRTPQGDAVRALMAGAYGVNSVDEVLQNARRYASDNTPEMSAAVNAALDELAARGLRLGPPKPGHMYEVEIGHPESALLDLDSPASGAHKAALLEAAFAAPANKWREMAIDEIASPGTRAKIPMESLLRAHNTGQANKLAGRMASQAAVAQSLFRSGVPGAKYFDGISRSAGEGTRNYVMFPGTEDRIRILRKYGLLPPLAGAGAMGGEE